MGLAFMLNLNKRMQADLSMLVVAFIWGTTFVVVKSALNDIGPYLFLGIRFIIAFLMLLLLSFQHMKQLRLSTISSGCLLGLFLFIGYTFQTVGLKYTTSSKAGFITGLSVVLVPVIYSLINRELPNIHIIYTVMLATVGLYLLSIPGNNLEGLGYGDFLVLICAFGFAFHIVFVDRYSHKHNPVAITSIQILFVGVFCLIIGLMTETWPPQFTLNVINSVVITSVFATSLAFLLMNALQKYSTPTRFAVILTTEPVFAALGGYLWGNEFLSPKALFGAGLIFLSMVVSILTRRNKNVVKTNV